MIRIVDTDDETWYFNEYDVLYVRCGNDAEPNQTTVTIEFKDTDRFLHLKLDDEQFGYLNSSLVSDL